jgi:hypothetical protein
MSFLTSLISRARLAEIRRGLLRLFNGAKESDEYTLPDLQEQLRQSHVEPLLPILAELTRDHVVDQVFRVLSPKHGGIHDFPSLDAVPDRIYDWHQDREIDVEPRMVRVIFRRHKERDGLALAATGSNDREG